METVGFLIAVGILTLLWTVEYFRRQQQLAMNLLLIHNAQVRQLLELQRQNKLSEEQNHLLEQILRELDLRSRQP